MLALTSALQNNGNEELIMNNVATVRAGRCCLIVITDSVQATAKNFLFYQFPSVTLSLTTVISVMCSRSFF